MQSQTLFLVHTPKRQADHEFPVLCRPGAGSLQRVFHRKTESAGMKERFRSKYLDIPNAPLYPFGYGLSYTTFDISAVTLDQNEMDKNGRIAAHVTVKNTGDTAGCDVVQLYIRDDYSDVVRPVRELKGFRRVELAPGKEQEVTFYITEEDLRYYRLDGTFGSEPGTFTVFVGDSSTTENSAVFTLK